MELIQRRRGMMGGEEDQDFENPLYLYNEGDENLDVTGGWQLIRTTPGTLTKNDVNMVVEATSATYGCCIGMSNFKSRLLKHYRSLNIKIDSYNKAAATADSFLSIRDRASYSGATVLKNLRITATGTYSLDIRDISNGWPTFDFYRSTITISKIWLEA